MSWACEFPFPGICHFSNIYLTISCQHLGVSLSLGIGLVSFPGLLHFKMVLKPVSKKN